MADDFVLKQDDQFPVLTATLKDASGTAIDLTTAMGVRFIMANRSTGVKKVDAPATIISAATGEVAYEWAADDVNTAGHYDAEFEVQHADGKLETYPNSAYVRVKILRDLGGIR